MAGTGCTITFIRKRTTEGDRIAVVVSFLMSAVSWNIGKNDLKLKKIEYMTVGARSFVSGDVLIHQNFRSATTAENGTIHGDSFSSGDQFVAKIIGL